MLHRFLILWLTVIRLSAAENRWEPVTANEPLMVGKVTVMETLAEMILRRNPLPAAALRLDFTQVGTQATGFERALAPLEHRLTSRHRVSAATLTRTVLVRENVAYIHLIADHPGALTFRVSLPGSRIEDRRQLISPEAHVWVLPFESDVAVDGSSSITVSGEGEALVIWVFGAEGRSTTLARLGALYDPGQTPPDPSKIWAGVSAAGENSP